MNMASSSENVQNRIPLNIEKRAPLNNHSLDAGHVSYLHHSDNPNCGLTNEPLTGSNYSWWKRSCEVSVSAKNKISFVTGEYAKPANNSPLLPPRERCDNMMICWLLHSVDKDIASSIIYTLTTAQIWKDLS